MKPAGGLRLVIASDAACIRRMLPICERRVLFLNGVVFAGGVRTDCFGIVTCGRAR